MRSHLAHLGILAVAASLVAVSLAGCQNLQASGVATTVPTGPTTVTVSPTTAPSQTTTTQDLVRVPSYMDFKPTYTGDDWNLLLESWRSAIEGGFSAAGLTADLQVVAPGDTEYQDPEAGSMVPRGTVVHIRVAVYD
jgi:hypothetical protein